MDAPLADNHETFPRGADRELWLTPPDEYPSYLPLAPHVYGESRDIVQNSHPYLTSIDETGEIPGMDEPARPTRHRGRPGMQTYQYTSART
jgi:hypothetical protein